MPIDQIIHIAGFIAISVAMFLFAANVLVVVARLRNNKKLADNLIRRLAPFAEIFRLETPRRRNGT
jgi:hypothetical protein